MESSSSNVPTGAGYMALNHAQEDIQKSIVCHEKNGDPIQIDEITTGSFFHGFNEIIPK